MPISPTMQRGKRSRRMENPPDNRHHPDVILLSFPGAVFPHDNPVV
jgi:hypothetical protein